MGAGTWETGSGPAAMGLAFRPGGFGNTILIFYQFNKAAMKSQAIRAPGVAVASGFVKLRKNQYCISEAPRPKDPLSMAVGPEPVFPVPAPMPHVPETARHSVFEKGNHRRLLRCLCAYAFLWTSRPFPLCGEGTGFLLLFSLFFSLLSSPSKGAARCVDSTGSAVPAIPAPHGASNNQTTERMI